MTEALSDLELKKESFKADVIRHYNRNSVFGANIISKVLPYALEHLTGAEAKALSTFNRFFDQAKIKRVRDITVIPHDRIESKKYLKCELHGGRGAKKGTYLSFSANSKHLTRSSRFFIGDECLEKLVLFVEGSKSTGYSGPEENEESSSSIRYEQLRAPLSSLPSIVKHRLREYGFNLEELVEPEVMRELQKQIMRDDYSGVEAAIDPGKFKGIIEWITSQKESGEINIPIVNYAAQLLPFKVHRLNAELSTVLLAYAYQARKLQWETQISDVKDDLLFLAEKRKISLNKEIKVPNLIDKEDEQFEKIKNFLNENKYSHLTKAQARVVRRSYPIAYLREEENKKELTFYAAHKEFRKLIDTLGERVDRFRAAEAIARKSKGNEPNPMVPWRNETYKVIKRFFKHLHSAKFVNPELSIRDYIVKNIPIREAKELIKILYVEGKKVEMLESLIDKNIKRLEIFEGKIIPSSYIALQELNGLKDAKNVLKKLVLCAIEDSSYIKDLPQHTRKKLNELGFKKYREVSEFINEIRESVAFGIIPTGNISNRLEKMVELTRYYNESRTTEKQVNYMIMLRDSFVNYKDEERSAETGEKESRKKVVKLDINQYKGKKYFTNEQIVVIDKVFSQMPVELQGLNPQEIYRAKEARNKLERFYSEHKVFAASHPMFNHDESLKFYEEEMPDIISSFRVMGKKFESKTKYQPVKSILARAKELAHYKAIDEVIKAQVLYLHDQAKASSRSGLREDILEILEDHRTRLNSNLRDKIQQQYREFNGPLDPKEYLRLRANQ
ncbi:MAG: hypothetical protein Q8R00_04355 [Candidatus Nanoarchaeia archaeon]|nr:hypothetical protein [Candidatus Nanoarchaeia archaeon]